MATNSLIEAVDSLDLSCSPVQCINNQELHLNSLVCSKCDRSVHYQCSGIPAYELQSIIKRSAGKSRKWLCCKCVIVSKELKDVLSTLTTRDSQNGTYQLKFEIARLGREIEACDGVAKAHKQTIFQQKEEIKSLRQALEKITDQFNGIEQRINQTIKENVETIGKRIEDSFSNNIKQLESKTEKSFANVVKENFKEHQNTPPNLRDIIKEARNEEQKEVKDKKNRRNNIIIHGANDIDSGNEEENIKHDKEFFDVLMTDLNIRMTTKTISRIGERDPMKKRPMKIALGSATEKDQLMKSLKRLKGNLRYKGISITDDYTKAERQLFKTWSEKAKEKNAQESYESNIVWRVRGSPSVGIYLKKFDTRDQASQQ